MNHGGDEAESDPFNAFVGPWHGPEAGAATGPFAGVLAGVPVAIKDCFYAADRTPTMGSRLHPGARPGTATVIERVVAAGARIVGFTNLHEWAVGGTSAISATGPIRNPRDPSLIAGGSSGGSAVAVATGAARAAIGTDAGGSVRIPAACCGVVGIKPTYGVVPMTGCVADGGPTDHVGALAGNVADAALLLEVMAGRRFEERAPASMRIGIARGPLFDDVQEPVGAAMAATTEVLANLVTIGDAFVDDMVELGRMNGRLFLADTAARLGDDLDRRGGDLQPDTFALLDRARRFSARELGAARDARDEARARWMSMFEIVDVLVTPTLPALPPPIERLALELPSGIVEPNRAFGSLNGPMNLLGLPALSLPVAEAGGLTVNATFTAAPGNDGWVIALGRAFEEARGRTT